MAIRSDPQCDPTGDPLGLLDDPLGSIVDPLGL